MPYWSRLDWPDGRPLTEQSTIVVEAFAVIKKAMEEVMVSELKRMKPKG